MPFPKSRIPVLFGGRSLLPFSDSFTQANGALNSLWDYTAGIWTVAGNAVLATPTDGANTITNGTFDVDANWNKGGGWSIDVGDSNKAAHAAGVASDFFQNANAAGTWYRSAYTVSDYAAGNFTLNTGGWSGPLRTADDNYIQVTRQTVDGNYNFSCNAAFSGSLDNATSYPLTLAHLFASRDFKKANVDISVNLTWNTNTVAGLVAGLNSTTAPTYFVIAYLYQTSAANTLRVEKCVNGTYTSLINAGVVYAAGAAIRLVKNGADVSAYYNGAQVGATQSLVSPADDLIINGTRHGIFSTNSATTLDNFSIVKA